MPSGSANSNSNSSGDARSPHPLLFSPLELRGMQLKNRLVVPPMVHYRAAPGAQMGNWHLVHLGRYAIGGFGLVIVEATAVEQVGLITEYDLGLWNDDQAESFRPLTEFFKSEGSGCKIGIQLAHGGRKASSQKAPDGMGPLTKEQIAGGAKHWTPVGPTATPTAEGWLTPRELTTQECEEMVGKWANSARLAVKAGFDMIELHMAHGEGSERSGAKRSEDPTSRRRRPLTPSVLTFTPSFLSLPPINKATSSPPSSPPSPTPAPTNTAAPSSPTASVSPSKSLRPSVPPSLSTCPCLSALAVSTGPRRVGTWRIPFFWQGSLKGGGWMWLIVLRVGLRGRRPRFRYPVRWAFKYLTPSA